MDFIKRRLKSFRFRAVLCLTLFSLFYILLVRPLRIHINQETVAPYFLSFDVGENKKLVNITNRRINIQPEGFDSPRGFGIPFGGYFWLPFALFIATRQKWSAIGLAGYHVFLGFVPPFLGVLLIKQHAWAGTALQVNEMVFQAVFLIALFFGCKAGLEQWQEEKKIM